MLEASSLCECEAIPWVKAQVAVAVCHEVTPKVLLFSRRYLQVFEKKNAYYVRQAHFPCLTLQNFKPLLDINLGSFTQLKLH